MALYQEDENAGNGFRDTYLKGVRSLIDEKRKASTGNRDAFMVNIERDRERYRRQYRAMLGWPLTASFETNYYGVKRQFVGEDELCRMYRVQLEVFPGFYFYGILFLTDESGPRPMVISQHGGGGTPERCSGLMGNSTNYNDMTRRILRRGVNAFAPQLLLWNESYGNDSFDRRAMDNDLKQLGGSITALEIHCISKSIDYLTTISCVDTGRIGMAGLSYGGFYTLYTTAAEPRIRSALTSCAFNDRIRYNWTDWTWRDAANTFLDSEIGALICPRYLFISVGDSDELFDAGSAAREYERLRSFYSGCPDHLGFEVFHGKHEFSTGDEGIDFLMKGISGDK